MHLLVYSGCVANYQKRSKLVKSFEGSLRSSGSVGGMQGWQLREKLCSSCGPKPIADWRLAAWPHSAHSHSFSRLYAAPSFWPGQSCSLSLTSSSLPAAPDDFQPAHTGCGFMVALI